MAPTETLIVVFNQTLMSSIIKPRLLPAMWDKKSYLGGQFFAVDGLKKLQMKEKIYFFNFRKSLKKNYEM